MNLDFIEHRRPLGPTHQWRPFGDGPNSDPNFNSSWWSTRNFLQSSRLLSITADGTEVARVEIDHHPGGTPYQVPVHDLVRELHYVEVSQAHRSKGIGTAIVNHLVEEFNDARLIASSNSAADFWSRIPGWDRFDHPAGLTTDWVVFVSPSISHARRLGSP